MTPDQDTWLTLDQDWLRRTAGWRNWERGVAYAEERRVGPVRVIPGGFAATVAGSRFYEACLVATAGGPTWDCDCPIGQDGELCKHVVALGVTILERAHATEPASAQADTPPSHPTLSTADLTAEDVSAWVRGLDAAHLATLLLDAAAADPALHAQLAERAGASLSGGHGADELRRAFDRAVQFPIGDRGRPTWSFSEGLTEVTGRMERFLAPGTAAALIDLVEHVLAVLEGLLDSLDDSEGEVGELIRRLFDLHLAACRQARPDPVLLARRLVTWALRSHWEFFINAVPDYADVLGPTGLAEARRVVQRRWDALPVLGPGDARGMRFSRERDDEPSRWMVATVMIGVADAGGDLEERIAVRERDLSSPRAHLDIATICLEAGDELRAIAWAERAVRDFQGRPGSEVLRFLAGRYQAQGREQAALGLAWADFVDRPEPGRYRQLLADAARTGAEAEWRTKALEHARGLTRRDARPGLPTMSGDPRRPWADWGGEGAAPLVELLLADGEVEAAWAAAMADGCRRSLWLRLAELREATDPVGAAAVYRCEVDSLIERKSRAWYAQAAVLIVKVRRLLIAAGDPQGADAYIAELRLEHKRRPSFLDELNRALARR
jgi:hypothetical protein